MNVLIMGKTNVGKIVPWQIPCPHLLTPYNFVVSSDHQGLFIDFDVDAFLGGDPSHLMLPAIQGIKSNSPKQCRKYVEAMTKYLTEHKVFDRDA